LYHLSVHLSLYVCLIITDTCSVQCLDSRTDLPSEDAGGPSSGAHYLHFTILKHAIVEDAHRFNTQPGFDNASSVANGCSFSTVPGVDCRYTDGSHSFEEPNGAIGLVVLDADVVLKSAKNSAFFDSLLRIARQLFTNPNVQPTNASKMSSGHVNIKMWKNSNKLASE
jgi:hypothetical protein